jgi:two-component system, cell cycle sensor histidine kinase and response regulator CckA
MSNRLRILHLEDDPDYSKLVRDLLARENVEADVELVKSQAEFEAALAGRPFDIILADYLLPYYTGIRALATARTMCPQTPFLLVSGTIGEQAAIESLHAGATDYVLKQWPDRLVPAVQRAIRESQERQQRRQVETELARREKYFRALTENTLDIITIISRDGIILYKSPSIKRVTGHDPQVFIGKKLLEFVHPDDLANVKRAFEHALMHPAKEVMVQYRLCRQDGLWVELEAIGQSRVDDPDIAGVVVNSRDVTAQRRLEEQFRQAQKMDAIGQLAGGVAHDFNNILTVIHGHASLLVAGGNLSPAAARSAQQIAQASERAAGLTRQLLTFSRRQVMQPRRLDMNEVVGNMTKMLGRILGEDVTLQVNYWPQPPLAQADVSMMEQVLLNLAVNARDAMPKGGQLNIRISVEEIGDGHLARHHEAQEGQFVRLTVTDTGTGIAPETLPRIFEPFFTTKEVGKGTGLGLATVYGIIKQHHGWIGVQSEVGKGTTFEVYIPSAAESQQTGEEQPTDVVVRGGTETILVVEDEGPVRDLVVSVLHGLGYRVLEAGSGSKAMKVWSESKGKVDLVLTDLVMPDRMNGHELAAKLRAERPELKVIFTSGYSADVVGKEFVLQPGLNYLQKPYHPQTLALTVRECLDSKVIV